MSTDAVTVIHSTLGGSPEAIAYDGRVHRFKLPDSRRKDSGWYVAHLTSGLPVVIFGDWRNQSEKYKIIGDQLADEREIERHRAERLRIEREQQARHKRTAALAERVWRMGTPCKEHPYLGRKGIGPHGGKRLHLAGHLPGWFREWAEKHALAGAFMLPMQRFGQVVDLQFITADNKLFLPGGDHRGATFTLGDPSRAPRMLVGTGFATCATLHECTGLPVVVAFSDGNLDPALDRLRRKYPDALITIAADNDIHLPEKRLNSGVVYATAAARKHDCLLAIPELNHTKIDFNDLMLAAGRQVVISQINAAHSLKPKGIEISAFKAGELLDLALGDWLDSNDDLAVKAPAGLGKTTRLLKLILERGLRCDYFVPSYALALEQAARLPGKAVAIRGRTHQTETNPPLCAKWESAYCLEKAGLAHQTMRLLCGTINPATGKRPCPYAGKCGYLQQFLSTAPIRFYAHEYLPLDNNRLSKREIDIAVIDESFRDSLEKVRKWAVGELLSQSESVYRDLVSAITENRLLSMSHSLDDIDRILNTETEIESHLHPEMDAFTAATKAKPLIEARRQPTGFLWNCKKAIESNGANRLWFKNVDGGAIFAAWTKPIQFIAKGTPTAFLDASLVESIIKTLRPDCRIVKIEAARQARMTQITDSALSYRRLSDDKDYLSARLVEFIHRLALENPNGAVIGPKFWMEAHGDRLPATVQTGHYGALRGLNALERCEWLVQIGRYQPPPYAVEEIARAWFPDAQLALPGAYLQQQHSLTTKDGKAGAVVWTHTHPDPRCREVLESIREQESLQAIDRLRLIHGKVKRVWLFSNHPLPGIEPDELATLDGLCLPGRLAEVALRDSVVVTGRKELATQYPDVFPNEALARDYIADVALNVGNSKETPIRFPDIYPPDIPIKNSLPLPTVNYRPEGQPGKARTAVTPYGEEGLEERLAAIHDRPVKIVRTPEQQRVYDLMQTGLNAWDAWRIVRSDRS